MEKLHLGFQPFNEYRKTRFYYHGFLPHLRQDGCTYFVTFRLDDSIPRNVLNEWKYERDCWLLAHGIDPEQRDWKKAFACLDEAERRICLAMFTSKMNDYLDRGNGSCVLANPGCAQIVAEALDHFHGTRLETGDFTVMPNHVHALMTPNGGFELEDILQSIKSYTAKQINKVISGTGAVWMKESYDHIVRDGEDLVRIQEYIRSNPQRSRLCDGQYFVSEARYELSLDHFREG